MTGSPGRPWKEQAVVSHPFPASTIKGSLVAANGVAAPGSKNRESLAAVDGSAASSTRTMKGPGGTRRMTVPQTGGLRSPLRSAVLRHLLPQRVRLAK